MFKNWEQKEANGVTFIYLSFSFIDSLPLHEFEVLLLVVLHVQKIVRDFCLFDLLPSLHPIPLFFLVLTVFQCEWHVNDASRIRMSKREG